MIKNVISEYLDKKGVATKLEHPAIEKFGDYAVRGDVDFTDLDIVEKVDKVSGFSNLWIKENVLIDSAKNILSDEFKKELGEIGTNKTVVIDYSAPNIAKPFGIGHLRSTNIGQAVYNIYQILGWKCIGDNHLGDWGTQFGKMITAIKHWGMEDSIEGLEKLYVRFHTESETDTTLIDEGREWFSKLEKGDTEARKIWQDCVTISMKEFNRVYDLLKVKIDNTYGESFYEKMLPEIVLAFKQKNLVKESEGALVIKYTNLPDALLLKSDGATNYLTRDLATIKFRIEKWNPDLIIYEVGSPQILHFRQLFEAAKMIGWNTNFYHLAHGQIRSNTGSFATRKGNTIHLADVIETAINKAKSIAPDGDDDSIMKVAIGAIKFADLVQDPTKDIIFDWNRVMSMEGNSAPYLQYTFARCNSVINKSSITNYELRIDEGFDENEKELLRYFYIFEEKIIEAGERYSPAVLAEYLLNLARKYNEFYAKCKIVGEPEEGRRVFLTQVTAKIIKDGLAILGIETLEKM